MVSMKKSFDRQVTEFLLLRRWLAAEGMSARASAHGQIAQLLKKVCEHDIVQTACRNFTIFISVVQLWETMN